MNKIGNLSPYFKRPYNGLYGISGTFPLAGIIDLSATESGGKVSLTWTDPDDVVKGGKTVASWVSTKIVRKEGSAPTDSTDGDLILTETIKNQYSSSGYIDSSIPASGTYYYVAFAVADNGLETISNIEEVEVVIATYKTYTIVRQEIWDPFQFFVRYEDDAVGMTQGSSDFDTFFGYSAVLLDGNGNEVEEVVQSSPGVLDMSSFQGALTGTANNVMIKFPRRGIKMTKDGTQITLSITSEPNKEGFQYYAFTKGETAKNYLYLGAYKGSFSNDDSSVSSSFSSSITKLKSRATGVRTANFSPAAAQTRANFRVSASNNGTGHSLITIYPRWYINCLMMMKYGNPYSQSIIGEGYTGGSQSAEPGTTNSQTSATYGTSSNTQQIKMFGLEDRRGNVNEFLDGCWFDANRNLTVDKTNSIFQDSDYITNLGVAQSGYMTGIDGSNDGMFRNIYTGGGSGANYYTDNSGSSSSRVLHAGGKYDNNTHAGAFCIIQTFPTSTNAGYGGRLMYL